MSESKIQQLVTDYLEKRIGLDVLESRLLDLGTSQESELSRRIVGLLAEASHAHWEEEELANAIRPFVAGFAAIK